MKNKILPIIYISSLIGLIIFFLLFCNTVYKEIKRESIEVKVGQIWKEKQGDKINPFDAGRKILAL